ncbi:DHA1 family multidrug resistance protein-like MFS transporter [Streptomyces sp. V4I23]|uniref:MFS transporter n=1 Tax=Streptomyces sp. V4I23 TaxID=3042282 RepID=UPI00278AC7D0|nr:MFS transporter [Streptomyces sp. V4I23]MDQ1007702.1 DHA1 family multidrug resistance protein-like MFS transporter [Streptomyces sp. V4I23]
MRETLALLRRTRGCLILLMGNFAITLGSGIVTPYLAIHLTQHEGLSPLVVGTALAVKVWSQFGLMLVGGAVSDRVGALNTMCLGVALRALSYLMLAFLSAGPWVIVACALMGFGGSLFVPAGKSALAGLVADPARMASVFAVRSAVNNTGLALGPLIGGLLLLGDPDTGLTVTALLFLALLPGLRRLRRTAPALDSAPGGTRRGRLFRGIPQVLRANPRLWWILSSATAFGFCYVQLEFAIPLMASRHQGPGFVGVLFAVNAVAVVVLQLFVSVPIGRWSNTALVVAGGLLTMGAGFGLMGTGALVWLIVGMLLFSLGEVVIDPRLDAEVTSAVRSEGRGTAFGLVGVCIAVGGAVANVTASLLAGDGGTNRTYWLLLPVVAGGLALLVWACFPRRHHGARPSATASPLVPGGGTEDEDGGQKRPAGR